METELKLNGNLNIHELRVADALIKGDEKVIPPLVLAALVEIGKGMLQELGAQIVSRFFQRTEEEGYDLNKFFKELLDKINNIVAYQIQKNEIEKLMTDLATLNYLTEEYLKDTSKKYRLEYCTIKSQEIISGFSRFGLPSVSSLSFAVSLRIGILQEQINLSEETDKSKSIDILKGFIDTYIKYFEVNKVEWKKLIENRISDVHWEPNPGQMERYIYYLDGERIQFADPIGFVEDRSASTNIHWEGDQWAKVEILRTILVKEIWEEYYESTLKPIYEIAIIDWKKLKEFYTKN